MNVSHGIVIFQKILAILCFDIQANSTGFVYEANGQRSPAAYDILFESKEAQTFIGRVRVNDAKNVTATLSVYGKAAPPPPRYISTQGFLSLFDPSKLTKSLTYIHVKNASVSDLKPFSQNSIGQRRQGDQLIYFESKNVTNISRFPSKLFEYSGSVSNEYITYVGFSFNVS